MKKGFVSSLSIVGLLALPSIARADSWEPLVFDTGDNRLFSDEQDWDPGAYKGECGQSWQVLAGISAMSTWYSGVWPFIPGFWVGGTHAALCVSNTNIVVNQYSGVTLNIYYHGFSAGSDNRLDTSTNDWSFGNWKAECAQNQVVTGISQWPSSQFSSIQCSSTNIRTAQSCEPHSFDGHDDRETTSRNDWSPGYWKGECSPGRYVKGVAMTTGQNMQAAAILCCAPGF